MRAIIFRTNHYGCNPECSLQEYIDKGLKVDILSEDKREATKECSTLQELMDIMDQTGCPLVIGAEDLNGRGVSVEIYDDYRD